MVLPSSCLDHVEVGKINVLTEQLISKKISRLPGFIIQAFQFIGFGALNFAAGAFCLNLFAFPTQIPVLWLPSGVMLAILFTTQRQRWPLILLALTIADFAAGLFIGLAANVAICFTFSHTIEVILAVLLIQRMTHQLKTTRMKRIWIAAAIGLVTFLFTALMAASFMYLLFATPFFTAWLSWYLSDSIGVLMVVPLVLAWTRLNLCAARSIAPGSLSWQPAWACWH